MNDSGITLFNAITAAVALAGLILGTINTFAVLRRDRVSVRVLLRRYVGSDGSRGICIEVVNLSYFTVTVTAVGIAIKGGEEFQMLSPIRECPFEVKPMGKVSLPMREGAEDHEAVARGKFAFARLATGERFRCRGKVLREIVARARHKY